VGKFCVFLRIEIHYRLSEIRFWKRFLEQVFHKSFVRCRVSSRKGFSEVKKYILERTLWKSKKTFRKGLFESQNIPSKKGFLKVNTGWQLYFGKGVPKVFICIPEKTKWKCIFSFRKWLFGSFFLCSREAFLSFFVNDRV